jgi:hypothetical protein
LSLSTSGSSSLQTNPEKVIKELQRQTVTTNIAYLKPKETHGFREDWQKSKAKLVWDAAKINHHEETVKQVVTKFTG